MSYSYRMPARESTLPYEMIGLSIVTNENEVPYIRTEAWRRPYQVLTVTWIQLK